MVLADRVMPYYMENEEWYTMDNETGETRLTEAGEQVPEAVKSYQEELELLEWGEKNGWLV